MEPRAAKTSFPPFQLSAKAQRGHRLRAAQAGSAASPRAPVPEASLPAPVGSQLAEGESLGRSSERGTQPGKLRSPRRRRMTQRPALALDYAI